MARQTKQEDDLEYDISIIKELIELLPYIYPDEKYCQTRIDFWEGEIVTREERLYNIRHGDRPCVRLT